jgi:hypothetical protein
MPGPNSSPCILKLKFDRALRQLGEQDGVEYSAMSRKGGETGVFGVKRGAEQVMLNG